MLDHPGKTARLLAALKAAAPFEVELTPEVVKQLQSEKLPHADRTHRVVSDLSYLGDEGGIVCHIVPPGRKRALFVSLTPCQDAPHHGACGGRACLSEASREEAQEAESRSLTGFLTAPAAARNLRVTLSLPACSS